MNSPQGGEVVQARITIAGNSRTGILLQLYLPKEWLRQFGVTSPFTILGAELYAAWGDEWGEERTLGKHCKNKAEVESELHFLRIALRNAAEWLAAEPVEYEIYVNLDSAPTSSRGRGWNNG